MNDPFAYALSTPLPATERGRHPFVAADTDATALDLWQAALLSFDKAAEQGGGAGKAPDREMPRAEPRQPPAGRAPAGAESADTGAAGDTGPAPDRLRPAATLSVGEAGDETGGVLHEGPFALTPGPVAKPSPGAREPQEPRPDFPGRRRIGDIRLPAADPVRSGIAPADTAAAFRESAHLPVGDPEVVAILTASPSPPESDAVEVEAKVAWSTVPNADPTTEQHAPYGGARAENRKVPAEAWLQTGRGPQAQGRGADPPHHAANARAMPEPAPHGPPVPDAVSPDSPAAEPAAQATETSGAEPTADPGPRAAPGQAVPQEPAAQTAQPAPARPLPDDPALTGAPAPAYTDAETPLQRGLARSDGADAAPPADPQLSPQAAPARTPLAGWVPFTPPAAPGYGLRNVTGPLATDLPPGPRTEPEELARPSVALAPGTGSAEPAGGMSATPAATRGTAPEARGQALLTETLQQVAPRAQELPGQAPRPAGPQSDTPQVREFVPMPPLPPGTGHVTLWSAPAQAWSAAPLRDPAPMGEAVAPQGEGATGTAGWSDARRVSAQAYPAPGAGAPARGGDPVTGHIIAPSLQTPNVAEAADAITRIAPAAPAAPGTAAPGTAGTMDHRLGIRLVETLTELLRTAGEGLADTPRSALTPSHPEAPRVVAQTPAPSLAPGVAARAEVPGPAKAAPAGSRVVEIATQDLGLIRLSFGGEGEGLRIVATADRGEVLDLMRRHATDLHAALRDGGYENATLSFAQHGRRNGPDAARTTIAGEEPAPQDMPAPAPRTLSTRSLDIRL